MEFEGNEIVQEMGETQTVEEHIGRMSQGNREKNGRFSWGWLCKNWNI